jgi:hypothetical protein
MRHVNNECRFDCHVPTDARCLGNRVQGVRDLKGQATISASEAEYKRRDSRAEMDMCTLDSSIFIEHIFNPVHQQINMAHRLIPVMG